MTPAGTSTSLTSIINGKKTHTHTQWVVRGQPRRRKRFLKGEGCRYGFNRSKWKLEDEEGGGRGWEGGGEEGRGGGDVEQREQSENPLATQPDRENELRQTNRGVGGVCVGVVPRVSKLSRA